MIDVLGLSNQVRTDNGFRLDSFSRVIGWDEQRFWVSGACYWEGDGRVSASGAAIIRYQGNQWFLAARVDNGLQSQILRLLRPDTVLFAGEWFGSRHVWAISSRGAADLGDVGGRQLQAYGADFVALASDTFFHTQAEMTKFEGTNPPKKVPARREEVVLDNATACPRHSRSPVENEAIAVFQRNLGHFHGGRWHNVGALPPHQINDVWLGGTPADYFMVLVGPGAWAHLHLLNSQGLDQPLAATADRASGNLIKVWGVSPELYWVMNDTGTVWERRGDVSQVVVAGLAQNGPKFQDAWVSPNGTVIAVTETQIYKLD